MILWTVVLEKPLESPLDSKEIQLVHTKGNKSWIFIRRTDAQAETSKLLQPDVKNWLIWKDPDAGKDWRREEKRDDRGWDDWMASPTQWTWVWVNSGSCWWTGRPSVLQSMWLQRIRHNWTELTCLVVFLTFFNWSLNCYSSSWSEPQSAPHLVFDNYIELLHLWLQET